MQTFDSAGTRIAFLDEGQGDPIVLVHGFASSSRINWVDTGWVALLAKSGFRVIALDNRGHGSSDKPYDLEAYGAPLMAEDVRRLLDHLAIERADVMGYSMGARISAFLALNHPARVRSLIFGGLGGNMLRPMPGTDAIAQALDAPTLDDVEEANALVFRVFADKTGSDRTALSACIRSAREPVTADMVGRIACPVLVAVGSADVVAGAPEELGAAIPGSEVLVIPRRDHMQAVGDRVFKDGAIDFLRRRP